MSQSSMLSTQNDQSPVFFGFVALERLRPLKRGAPLGKMDERPIRGGDVTMSAASAVGGRDTNRIRVQLAFGAVGNATIAATTLLGNVAGGEFSCTVTLRNATGGAMASSPYGDGTLEKDAVLVTAVPVSTDTNATAGTPIVFAVSMLSPGMYSAVTQLEKVSLYNVSASFAGAQLFSSAAAGGVTIQADVTASTPIASTLTVNCPNDGGMVGAAVVCAISVADAQDNPAGDASHAPNFELQVTDASGTLLISAAAVTHASTTGAYSATFMVNRSGPASVEVRYGTDGTFSAQTIAIRPGMPAAFSNASCSSALVRGGALECSFTVVDAWSNPCTNMEAVAIWVDGVDNSVPGGKLSLIRAVAKPSDSIVTRPAIIRASGETDEATSTGTYVVSVPVVAGGYAGDGSIAVTFGGVGNVSEFYSGTAQLINSTIDPGTSTMTCTASMLAGDVLTCAIVGRDSDGNPVGGAESATAWSVISTLTSSPSSATPMAVSYSGSAGVFSATVLTTQAGTYVATVSFGGVALSLNATAATSIVQAGSVSATTTTVDCPRTVESSSALVCTVSARDALGNPTTGVAADGLQVRAILPDGTSSVASLLSSRGDGRFVANFTAAGWPLVDGSLVEIHARLRNSPIAPDEVGQAASADGSGGPVPTTVVTVAPDTEEPAPVEPTCVTLESLQGSCLASRGKWGFTCAASRPWKRSGGCPAGMLFSPVLKKCKPVCDAASPSPSSGGGR